MSYKYRIAGVAAEKTLPSKVILPPKRTKVNPGDIIEIKAGAFADNAEITEIIIPANITIIGEGVFSNCENLKSITFQCPYDKLTLANGWDNGLEDGVKVTYAKGDMKAPEVSYDEVTGLLSIVNNNAFEVFYTLSYVADGSSVTLDPTLLAGGGGKAELGISVNTLLSEVKVTFSADNYKDATLYKETLWNPNIIILEAGKISVYSTYPGVWEVTVTNPNTIDVDAKISQTFYKENGSTNFGGETVEISAKGSYKFDIDLSKNDLYKKVTISVTLSADGASNSSESVETVECPMLNAAKVDLYTGGTQVRVENTNSVNVTATFKEFFIRDGKLANYGESDEELDRAGAKYKEIAYTNYDGIYMEVVLSAPGYRSSTTVFTDGDVGDFTPDTNN